MSLEILKQVQNDVFVVQNDVFVVQNDVFIVLNAIFFQNGIFFVLFYLIFRKIPMRAQVIKICIIINLSKTWVGDQPLFLRI